MYLKALTECNVPSKFTPSLLTARPISQTEKYTRLLSHLYTQAREKLFTAAKNQPTNPTGNGLNLGTKSLVIFHCRFAFVPLN